MHEHENLPPRHESGDRRRRLIVERAMAKMMGRGYREHDVATDWRDAEREIDEELARRR